MMLHKTPPRPPNINWNNIKQIIVPAAIASSIVIPSVYLIDNIRESDYILTSDQFYISKKNIRWIKEDEDCFYICTNDRGCLQSSTTLDKWKVCKDLSSYEEVKDLVHK